MTATQYEEILLIVTLVIQKSSTKRECIGPDKRLSVTLRYLATGGNFIIAQSIRNGEI